MSLSLIAPAAMAQTGPPLNAFQFFGHLLEPIAIKWACGANPDQDLAALQSLIAAFPKDAEAADVRNIVKQTLIGATQENGLSEIFGADLDEEQKEIVCAAAHLLTIDWMTPKVLINDPDGHVPDAQRQAWKAFYQTLESLHVDQSKADN